MKRYWLFAFGRFYPSGGMEDFEGSFDTVKECVDRAASLDKYYNVLDIVERKVVAASCGPDEDYTEEEIKDVFHEEISGKLKNPPKNMGEQFNNFM